MAKLCIYELKTDKKRKCNGQHYCEAESQENCSHITQVKNVNLSQLVLADSQFQKAMQSEKCQTFRQDILCRYGDYARI